MAGLLRNYTDIMQLLLPRYYAAAVVPVRAFRGLRQALRLVARLVQSIRGIPRRSNKPAMPKTTISTRAMTK